MSTGGYFFAVFLKDGLIEVGVGRMDNDGKWNQGFLIRSFERAQGNLGESIGEKARKERKKQALDFGAYLAETTKIKMYVDFRHFG